MKPTLSNGFNKIIFQRLVLVVLVLGVLAAIFAILSNFLDQRTVTLKPASGVTITFGTSLDSENGPAINEVLVKTTSIEKIKVHRGAYVAMFTGSGEYAPQYRVFEVTSDITVISPSPVHSHRSLDKQLQQESSVIHSALQDQIYLGGYSVQAGQLYQDGTWYAAKLIPDDPIKNNTTLVIMQKQSGKWQLVAGPEMTFYIGDYPKIPGEVIRDINNR